MFLAAATAGIVTVVAAGWRPVLRMDRHVAVDLHALALEHPNLTHANRILTDWALDPWTMRLLLAAVAVWLWRRRERLLALFTAGTSAVEAGVRQVLRWAIGRERPRWERPVDSADFAALPSGHAMTAAASCVLLLWLARRAQLRSALWHTALAGAVLAVAGACFTRIFLGVHWLTDTLAGALLGAALATAAIATWHSITGPRPARAAADAKPAAPPRRKDLPR
ncbi:MULTISPECIES: phosphatase PAP2 family protein [Streptomyces]|uniref:Phosphatase PAP2 family protein n=1 Tax=Streptomyces bacillaris TaxID=68179 RepID=A0ABW6E519_9ACTN|nr:MULTISPECIES: phosphatase PAP2 family protein [Streptomyces]